MQATDRTDPVPEDASRDPDQPPGQPPPARSGETVVIDPRWRRLIPIGT